MSAYFERIDATTFQPTPESGGAWRDAEIHFSPLGGLIVHAIDRHRAEQPDAGGKVLGRVSFDILGVLDAEPCDIRVRTIRPGRSIELVEASVTIGGRTAVLARAWYEHRSDTRAVAGGEPPVLAVPGPEHRRSITDVWPGGYVASLEMRSVEPPAPGRTTAWLRTDRELVAGVPSTPVARYVALVDTANGVAVRRHPTEWMFPNLDLTIHLYREPEGPWVGLDTTVVFGPTGQGLTSTVLHDQHGGIGTAQQTLTLRELNRA